MKKLIISAFLLLALKNSYSQCLPSNDSMRKAAGSELVTCTKRYYTGKILYYGGNIITIVAAARLAEINSWNLTHGKNEQKDPGIATFGVITGGILSITGFLTSEFSFMHIKRAGLILGGDKIGISYRIN